MLAKGITYCQPVFQKLIGDPQSNVSEFLYDAAIDSTGSLYYAGSNVIGSFNIAKADSLGNVIWNKNLSKNPTQSGSQKIIITRDNNIVVCGYSNQSNYIMKLDTAANILWSKYWDVNSGIGGSITYLIEDSIGNFIFGGYRSDYDSILSSYVEKSFFIKSDIQGNFIWSKISSNIHNCRISDMIFSQSGNYILLGWADGIIGGKDILLIEMDSSGFILKSKVFGNITDDFGEKLIYFNNNLVISSWDYNGTGTGNPTFISLDSAWNILSANKILWPTSGNTLGISQYKNQSLIVCSNGPMLYLLDHNLQPTKGFNYGSSGFNRMLLKSFNTTGGGIYAVGRNLPNPDILLVKTDSLFNIHCYSYSTSIYPTMIPVILSDTLTIQLTSPVVTTFINDSIANQPYQENILCSGFTSLNESYNEIVNFVILNNPVRNSLKLKFSNFSNYDKYTFTLVDVLGKTIQKVPIIDPNYLELEISYISSGTYSIILLKNEIFFSAKKFIKVN